MFHRFSAALRRTLPRLRSHSHTPPTSHNRGVKAEHFRALWSAAPPHMQRKYRLRWDWHLRNLIYAMIPAFVMYVFLSIAERRFQLEDQQMRDSLHRALRGETSEEDVQGNQGERKGQRSSIEVRVAELERLIAVVAGGNVVDSARTIANEIARGKAAATTPDRD